MQRHPSPEDLRASRSYVARGSHRRFLSKPSGWLSVCAVATLALLTPAPLTRVAAAHVAVPPAASISLAPNLASPQPVGTPITWTATVPHILPLVYQFSVALTAAGPYQVLRDYSTLASFVWVPLQEGAYYIQVTVKTGYAGVATSSKSAMFTVTSRVTAGHPVVSRLANPQVALYSAPACPTGRVITVAFRAVSSASWTTTNVQPCQASLSRNFFVAGMLARTLYELVNVVLGAGQAITSTPLYFLTGAPPTSVAFPTFSVPQPPTSQSDTGDGLIVHFLAEPMSTEAPMIATDLQRNIVWYDYQPGYSNVNAVRIQQVGGVVGEDTLLFANDGTHTADNIFRTTDLAGDPLQETNIQAINQQLRTQGQRIIYGFSHDALILPNGDTALIGFTQDVITTTAIMGDMLVVLDKNLQVAWTWDAFAHLNPLRGPTLGEICSDSYTPCPIPGGESSIDWTHANAIDYSPSDGNIILSLRNQDWVIKINYNNGSGDGSVLWRLGPQGDFTLVPLNPRDPYPWFSHQHDANYLNSTTLELFDNGNTRCAPATGSCDSRGQVYTLDEQNKVATQVVSDDLGNYSDALGVAQRLSNGNYNFTSGVQTFPPPPFGQEIEVLPNGTKSYVQQVNTFEYRAWRLPSLDSPTNLPCSGC